MSYSKIFYDKTKQQRMAISTFADYAREIIDKYKDPIPFDDLVTLLEAKLKKENIMFVESWCAPTIEVGIKLSICEDLTKEDFERIDWPKT